MTDKREKVLHILGALRFSGAEIMLNAGFSTFSRHPYAHHILATGEEVGDYAETLRRTGYEIHHVPFRRSPAYFWRLFSFLRAQSVSVVHIHTERASFWTALTVLAAGARCVRTIHATFDFPPHLRRVRGLQRRLMARMGVHLVACSQAVAANEAAAFGYTPHVLRNGYDPSRVALADLARRGQARRALAIAADEAVIISVGNCASVKNHGLILQCLQKFPPAERPLYLHCGAGHGEEGEDQLARRLGIEDRVRFLGSVADIGTLLAASDVFVCSSSHEGGPVALLEAAAAGLPCVTTPVGLAPELAKLPNIHMAPADADTLAERIRGVLRTPLRARMRDGKLLSQAVRERYSLEKTMDGYAFLYGSRRHAVGSLEPAAAKFG